ncbi:MAG: DUF1203 domain-containing protein [Alphaproteobacteria bacterium]|nr:DUF1203 domain-containing protein [Alphaproteobacteria bacterium]
MRNIHFIALETKLAEAWRAGAPDANGQAPERRISDGSGVGVPCRHCLRHVAAGEPYLVLAHRPFATLQPYAEVGPIFIHAEACARGGGGDLPTMFASPSYIVRGYGADDRIVYGTGGVVETETITERAAALLARDDIAYVHTRSAANNCFHCRVENV